MALLLAVAALGQPELAEVVARLGEEVVKRDLGRILLASMTMNHTPCGPSLRAVDTIRESRDD